MLVDPSPFLPGNMPRMPRTDPDGWRLVVSQDSHGQHKWLYLPPGDDRRSTWPQTPVDKYWLGLETVSMPFGWEEQGADLSRVGRERVAKGDDTARGRQEWV